ncbi:hypothetical protein BDZ89DRAFT_1039611 [Hymenopellis radicata]|nr:hypothetical protein BDZ89DRAFT_1039611 [Hymenopellis radicata]
MYFIIAMCALRSASTRFSSREPAGKLVDEDGLSAPRSAVNQRKKGEGLERVVKDLGGVVQRRRSPVLIQHQSRYIPRGCKRTAAHVVSVSVSEEGDANESSSESESVPTSRSILSSLSTACAARPLLRTILLFLTGVFPATWRCWPLQQTALEQS